MNRMRYTIIRFTLFNIKLYKKDIIYITLSSMFQKLFEKFWKLS